MPSLNPIFITTENPPSSLPRRRLDHVLVSSLLSARNQVEFPVLVDTIHRSILSERLSWQDPMKAWSEENEVQLKCDIIDALANLGIFTVASFLVLTEDAWRSMRLPGRFTEARRLVLETMVVASHSAIDRGFFWSQVSTKLRLIDRGRVAAFPGIHKKSLCCVIDAGNRLKLLISKFTVNGSRECRAHNPAYCDFPSRLAVARVRAAVAITASVTES